MTGPHGPLPDFGRYPYISDAGISSIAALTALVRSSGVDFRVGSAYRPGDPLWHGQENAIDVFASTQGMNEIAAYCFQYAEFLLELIHTSNLATGAGWFVDNGIAYHHFSEKTMREHVNHVHIAATNSGLAAAAAQSKQRLRKGSNAPAVTGAAQHTVLNPLGEPVTQNDPPKSGCFPAIGKGVGKAAAGFAPHIALLYAATHYLT